MKTILLSLLSFCIVPATLMAQPTISNNEFYNIGDVIEMVNCNSNTVSAGASGAGVTWDFSTLVATGGLTTITITRDTSAVFITSNILETYSNGSQMHVQENSTDSYINGIVDTTTGEILNYYNYDISRRPATYNHSYVDTFSLRVTSPFTHGTGYITQTGDAYGTLKLPNGTYSNVLRVRKFQNEIDTNSGGGYSVTNTTSYLWFDNAHNAPLFRLDSTIGAAGTVTSAMYLSVTTGISNVNDIKNNYRAHLDNNGMVLTGDFAANRIYNVELYSITGVKIFSEEFTAKGNTTTLYPGNQLSPGMYLVSIAQKNDVATKAVIKVMKL